MRWFDLLASILALLFAVIAINEGDWTEGAGWLSLVIALITTQLVQLRYRKMLDHATSFGIAPDDGPTDIPILQGAIAMLAVAVVEDQRIYIGPQLAKALLRALEKHRKHTLEAQK